MNKSYCGAILLAAGQSKRMKTEKAFLAFDKEKTFLTQLIDVYQDECDKIVIIRNAQSKNWDSLPLPPSVSLRTNLNIELGRSHSIFLALEELQNYSSVFIQNIDNPFTDHIVLNSLLENKEKADYLFPKFQNKGGHPLLLNKKVIDLFLKNYSSSFHFREFLAGFTSYGVEVKSELYSININTPEDYLRYFTA